FAAAGCSAALAAMNTPTAAPATASDNPIRIVPSLVMLCYGVIAGKASTPEVPPQFDVRSRIGGLQKCRSPLQAVAASAQGRSGRSLFAAALRRPKLCRAQRALQRQE